MKLLWSLRAKTLVFPLCFMLVMLLVSFNFLYIYIEQSLFTRGFQEQKLEYYSQITNVYASFSTNHALIYDSLREFQLGNNKEELYKDTNSWVVNAQSVFNGLVVLAGEINNNQKNFPLDKLFNLMSSISQYNQVTESALKLAAVDIDSSYLKMAEATAKYSEIIKKFNGLIANLDKNLAEQAGLVESRTKGGLVVFLIVLVVSCFCSFILSLLYASNITRPLFNIVASIKEMAGGNKSMRCQIETSDEIGNLAREVNKLAESLEYAEAVGEEKSSFLANMSHEIRTPLNGIVATAELLMETSSSSSERSSYVELIYKSSKSLLSVIDDVLDYSRVEAGKIDVDNKKFSLKLLLEEIKALFVLPSEEKNIKFFLKCSDKLSNYYIGDEGRIRQILLHLLGNAIKFTFRGCIVVDVDSAIINYKNWVIINVRDTGIGIDHKNINNIFKGFYQVEHSSTRSYGGSGLGLAISQKLAQLMSGQLLVASNPGQGSTFTLRIPLEPIAAPVEQTPAEKQVRDYNKRVLVVDDTPSNQMIARAVLSKLGFSVVITDNGKAALTQLLNQYFDIVFMDMHMPVLDGIEATKQIRQLKGKKGKIPIIALTANVLPEDKALCIQAGMDGVITKPITKDKIIAEIDRVLSYKATEDDDNSTARLVTEN
ncbi:ATP-binding protein [Spartinivicinus ruber]|uniref:ATP-binding protein n=1 Tax=Spartinivicinus ruber TaxID=2683272 RepID=UPI0013CFDE4C|nr:ATP-binding protein [Spartinivicinus ruber]